MFINQKINRCENEIASNDLPHTRGGLLLAPRRQQNFTSEKNIDNKTETVSKAIKTGKNTYSTEPLLEESFRQDLSEGFKSEAKAQSLGMKPISYSNVSSKNVIYSEERQARKPVQIVIHKKGEIKFLNYISQQQILIDIRQTTETIADYERKRRQLTNKLNHYGEQMIKLFEEEGEINKKIQIIKLNNQGLHENIVSVLLNSHIQKLKILELKKPLFQGSFNKATQDYKYTQNCLHDQGEKQRSLRRLLSQIRSSKIATARQQVKQTF